MSDSDKQCSISKFNGIDFPVWSLQMQSFLAAKDLDAVLTAVKTETNKAVFEAIDKKAKSYLLMSLDNQHVKLVLSCSTAKEIWDRLSAIHKQKSSTSKIVLQTQFFDARMNQGEKVAEYISRIEYLASQLKDAGEEVKDSTLVGKIVSGLPETYSSFMSSWMGMDAANMTLNNLLPRLMAEEAIKQKFDGAGSSAMAAQSNATKKGKNSKQPNRSSSKQNINELKKRTKCRKCGQKGHWKAECPQVSKDGEKQDDTRKQKQKTADSEESSAVVAEANFTDATDGWIIDSGATEHMTFEKSAFESYKQLDSPRVIRYGNSGYGYGIGIGDIKAQATLEGGKTKQLVIKDVLHVPGLRRKLFSVSASTNHGNVGKFSKDKLVITNSHGETQLIAKRDGNLYRAVINEIPSETHAALSEDNVELWHERLGHANKKIVELMIKNKVADGLPEKVGETQQRGSRAMINCISCALGKQHHKAYRLSTRRRAEEVGQRIHVDICGTVGVETISGSKYFVLFKDEFSNYRHIYFIKTKDQAYDSLKKCVATIEADTNQKVKRLVSDRGSELTSKRTQEFLMNQGISHEVSAPFTPQQNGFIERDNRTVMEAARSMLFHKKLEEKLWGEAANTAIYLMNRVPNKNTGNATPFELYFKRKPRLSHVRIFGSLAIIKQQEKKRSGYQQKLEPRGKKGILVGFDRDFTYRVYEPVSNSVIITRDVEVDETLSYHDEPRATNYDSLTNAINELPDTSISTGEYVSLPDLDSDSVPIEEASSDEADDPQEDIYENLPANVEEVSVQEQQPLPPPRTSSQQTSSSQQRRAEPVGVASTYNLRSRKRAEGDISEVLLAYDDEPSSYDEAVASQDSDSWIKAMDDEYESLMKNKTWILTKLPPGRKPITTKWVYKLKRKIDGSIERFKARLVARGFSQRAGLDYKETFSPVVRLDSVRLILAIAAHENLALIHFDVRTAFLHGTLEEDIYMLQPQGYEVKEDLVCKLVKSLYGLKQASRAWNTCFIEFLKKFNLVPLQKDSCILVRKASTDKITLLIAIYVDDGLACSSSKSLLKEVIAHLKSRFEISVMDPKCFVGLEIKRNRAERTLTISQNYYISRIIKRFNMSNAKPASTPADINLKLTKLGGADGEESKDVAVPYREAIGSLLYAVLGTRPDISYIVNYLARFCEQPKEIHWNAVKRVFKYLLQTQQYGLTYGPSKGKSNLICYVDADFAGDVESRKSTSGYMVLYGSTPIIWKSTKQSIVATSTTEAEFVAASTASREVLWARQLLFELGRQQQMPTKVYIDNQAAIKLVLNQQIHAKTKHIDVTYMFVRDIYNNREIDVEYIKTEDQIADFLTKPLAKSQFNRLVAMAGMSMAS